MGGGEGRDLLLLSNSGNLLLDSLLDKLLGLLKELKLSQLFLKELESADLVDACEDEEEDDWAHGVHLWPVLNGILLVSHNSWVSVHGGLFHLSLLPESWSIDSVKHLSHVNLFECLLFVVIEFFLFIIMELFLESMLVGFVLLSHLLHDVSEVVWNLLVEGFVVLHIHLIHHLFVLLKKVVIHLASRMVSSSQVSLGSLNDIGSHVEKGGVIIEEWRGCVVVMSLNPIKGSFEHSVLLSVENVEDEEGQEHEEMSIEHSLSNSRLLFMGSSKSSLAHSEKEECDEDREDAHVPKAVIDNLL